LENRAGILYNDTVDQLKASVGSKAALALVVFSLGSAFVLGTKCHGFQFFHPYLNLLLWAVRRVPLRSIQIGHTKYSLIV
jgi:hypothetical protein